MSHSIPQEILDLIIDHLRDEPTTLKRCSIVSKAWIPRVQKHLFATVKFQALYSPVSRWRVIFPDPANSPARHTRALFIGDPQCLTVADVDTLLTFCDILHLGMHADDEARIPVPLYGFLPVLRTLHLSFLSFPPDSIFDSICSFPLLEDLTLSGLMHGGNQEWNAPSTSPRLTGSLDLRCANDGAWMMTDRLLTFPNGLHFTKIAMMWHSGADVLSTVNLLSRCSDTLEYLDITNDLLGTFPSARARFTAGYLILHIEASRTRSLDLSKCTKLKEITFRCGGLNVRRIITALQTIEPNTIQQVTIMLIRSFFVQETNRAWLDLDSLLVHFWTSRSLRLKVVCEIEGASEGEKGRKKAAMLLPELTKRLNVDLRLSAELYGPTFPSFTAESMLEWTQSSHRGNGRSLIFDSSAHFSIA